MEIKNNQLTIDIPEGMEIDLENSDLAKGIVRFKQSTYEDTLKLDKNCKSIIINESNASKLVTLSRFLSLLLVNVTQIQDNLIKIVSIQGNYVYYICLDNFSICRENSCLLYIQGWKKITSKQFKNAYLAVMKDIQDPDLGSNWNTVYNSIVTSVNS